VLAAVFTRFGTLLVKMMVDIGNIAINTIVGSNTDLIVNATLPLVKDAFTSAGVAMGGMAVFAGSLSLPYANLAAALAGVAGITGVGLSFMGFDNPVSNAVALTVVTFAVKWIFEILTCFALSGVLYYFYFTFLSKSFYDEHFDNSSTIGNNGLRFAANSKIFQSMDKLINKMDFFGNMAIIFINAGHRLSGIYYTD